MKSGRGRGGGGRLQTVVVLDEINGISAVQGPASRLVDGRHRRGRILLLAEHPSEVPRHRPGILRRSAHTTLGDGHLTAQRKRMIILQITRTTTGTREDRDDGATDDGLTLCGQHNSHRVIPRQRGRPRRGPLPPATA